VQSGAVVGGSIVIEQGLTAGEQVAASGSFKLREAVLVAIAPAQTADAIATAAHAGGAGAKQAGGK
jgi:membrane fusion protein (multidrug efflux system)